MRGDVSAYETLGLRPGADQLAIERAYKTLIKRYHPDRPGGDAARASEINRAYFQLRRAETQPVERAERGNIAEALYARWAAQPKPRRSVRKVAIWPFVLIAVALLVSMRWDRAIIFAEDWVAEVRRRVDPPVHVGPDVAEVAHPSVSLDQPIANAAVFASVQRASSLHRSGREQALVEESRSCHVKLRARPSLERLDGCAAFDDAVLELQRRDPLRDEGPFGASAVTARQITGASLLSNDYLAIEARLDQVRSRVQLMLTPAEPPPAAPQAAEINSDLP